MLAALSSHTLIAGAVGSAFAESLDIAALEAGADAADRVGLARAAFSVRSLDVFGVADRNARACYLLGAVLTSDLATLQHSRALGADSGAAPMPVWVVGRPLVRDALCHLMRRLPGFGRTVQPVADSDQADLAGRGACLLARRRGLM